MDTYETLRRVRDRIERDYLADPKSEILYVRRLPVRHPPGCPWSGSLANPREPQIACPSWDATGDAGQDIDLIYPCRAPLVLVPGRNRNASDRKRRGDAGPIGIGRFLDAYGDEEPEEIWAEFVTQVGMEQTMLIQKINQGPAGNHEYLACRRDDGVALRRFLTHLRVLGRFLAGCRQGGGDDSILPPRVLDFCLHYASVAPERLLLGAFCFFAPRGGGPMLTMNDRFWDSDTWSAYFRGVLDWEEGEYFFVLEADARFSVIQCIDQYLQLAPLAMVPRVAIASPGNPLPQREPLAGQPYETSPPGDEEGEPESPRPNWDRRDRKLWFHGVCCTQYGRSAKNQFDLLDAFQRAGWSECVQDPFGLDRQLYQTIDDLNAKLARDQSPIRFRVLNTRANWYILEGWQEASISSANSSNSSPISRSNS